MNYAKLGKNIMKIKDEKNKYTFEVDLIPKIGNEICAFLFKKWPDIFNEGDGPRIYKENIERLLEKAQRDYPRFQQDLERSLQESAHSHERITFLQERLNLLEKSYYRKKKWQFWKPKKH